MFYQIHSLELFAICLFSLFKQQFSMFKQHYTYFYILFYLHIFPKNTNNITRNFLPNGPLDTYSIKKLPINIYIYIYTHTHMIGSTSKKEYINLFFIFFILKIIHQFVKFTQHFSFLFFNVTILRKAHKNVFPHIMNILKHHNGPCKLNT